MIGSGTIMFNPYTGHPRVPDDIRDDPFGIMLTEPGVPLPIEPRTKWLDPGIAHLLRAVKFQLEEDAVYRDATSGWCRPLAKLVEQDAMPKAWDYLVNKLKEYGHAV